MHKKPFFSKMTKFIAVAAICFLFIFTNPKGIFDPFRAVFFKLAYPFQKTSHIISGNISETAAFLSSISSMREENERLIRENDALVSEAVSLQEMKKENELLRSQLELKPKDKFDLEASLVIGRDPQGLGNWIMIDKGRDSGLRPGMTVIVSEGILVGRVEETYADSSKINLLTDSGSTVNAMDLETGAKGLMRGTFGLGLLLDRVAQSEVLNKGDSIVTSGLDGEFPKGLLIGTVQETKESQDKLFQQAIVAPRIKYQDLEVIFVIKNQ